MTNPFRPRLESLSKRGRRAFALQQQQLRESGYQHLRQQQQESQFFAGFGNAPGIGQVLETFEQAFSWGPMAWLQYASGYISANAVDVGNTPTTTLRPGLIMGIQSSTGAWTNYSPTATDGSQIAQGVLPIGLPMLDPLSNVTQAKVFGILVAGGLQAAKCIGLDFFARANMSNFFLFDDFQQGVPAGTFRYPWSNFATKTASYQVLTTDNFTLFDNNGAAGAITFTLPPIQNGQFYGFRAQTGQNLLVTSTEGGNLVAFNNAGASTVSFQSGGAIIGGMFILYSNPGATKWIVETASAGANTVTVA